MNTYNTTENIIDAKQLLPQNESGAITCRVQRHDSLCIIGPDSNSLCRYLRTLAGITPPQSGELSLFNRPLTSLDKKEWCEQRQYIGFVARRAPILSVLRGLDNVMLPALYHKRMTRVEARERAIELIAQTGCEGDIHKLPAYLNVQQRMQLAIARAAILEPPVMFVEEPFSILSLAEQQPIYQYLVNWSKNHAMVLATHNLNLVKACATQIIFVGDNSVQQFNGWQPFANCPDNEVTHYLQHNQQ